MLLGMIVLGVAAFAAMFAFVVLVRPRSLRCRHDRAVVAVERGRVRVPACTRCCGRRISEARSMATEIAAVVVTLAFTIVTSLAVGQYMCKVFTGERTLLDPAFVPIERLVLRVVGVGAGDQQDWKQYAVSLLVSNVVMWLVTFAIVSLQGVLPLNPDGIARHGADARLQHHLQLRDQHQPPALQRRDRAVVPLADVRDHLPAVRHRGHRHGGVHRHDPRPGRQPARPRSATSTSTARGRRSACCCRSRWSWPP